MKETFKKEGLSLLKKIASALITFASALVGALLGGGGV